MSHTDAARGDSAQSYEFISDPEIIYGPRELFARFFLLADKKLRERGVTVTIGTFDELLEVNSANRDTWLPLTPSFNVSYNTLSEDRSVCFIGRDKEGKPVATHAGRLFDWRESSFGEEAETLRLFYDVPNRHALPGESCQVSAERARAISGLISYTGGVWYQSDFRGRGLLYYMTRLMRAYTYGLWGVDYNVAMVGKSNVAKGLPQKMGHTDVEDGVHSRNSTHGDVDYHVTWSNPRQIFEQLTETIDAESDALSSHKGRA